MPYKDETKQKEAVNRLHKQKAADKRQQGYILTRLWIKPQWKQKIVKLIDKLRSE